MAETIPRHILFGVVIFSFVITSGMWYLSGLNYYGASTTNNYESINNSFNVLNNASNGMGVFQGSLSAQSDKKDSLISSLTTSVWGVMFNFFDTFSFIDSIFNSLTTQFGIPTYMVQTIITLLAIVLVFGIFGIIFYREL
jgi:hypothetical protein